MPRRFTIEIMVRDEQGKTVYSEEWGRFAAPRHAINAVQGHGRHE